MLPGPPARGAGHGRPSRISCPHSAPARQHLRGGLPLPGLRSVSVSVGPGTRGLPHAGQPSLPVAAPGARPPRWRCPARTRQRRGAQRTPRAACRPLLPAAPSPQPAWGAPGRHGCVPARTCVGASSETGHGRERRHGRACVCGVSVHICACACTWEHGRAGLGAGRGWSRPDQRRCGRIVWGACSVSSSRRSELVVASELDPRFPWFIHPVYEVPYTCETLS